MYIEETTYCFLKYRLEIDFYSLKTVIFLNKFKKKKII